MITIIGLFFEKGLKNAVTARLPTKIEKDGF